MSKLCVLIYFYHKAHRRMQYKVTVQKTHIVCITYCIKVCYKLAS